MFGITLRVTVCIRHKWKYDSDYHRYCKCGKRQIAWHWYTWHWHGLRLWKPGYWWSYV